MCPCDDSAGVVHFRVRLLRPARVAGRVVAGGAVVVVEAAQAADLIRAEAAMLVSDRDLPELVRALGLRSGARRPAAA